MKDLDCILGQTQAVKQLKAALQNKLISHAYLFSGPDGVGKKTAAIAFAAALTCENPLQGYKPCGKCLACRKMEHDNSSHLLRLEPEGQSLKIKQIRDMQLSIAYIKLEDKYQVVLIEDAQKMTAEAANSFLKILEEPPQSTVFILIADNSKALLSTIVSRCQVIRFVALAPGQLSTILTEDQGFDPVKAGQISLLSEGSVSKALQIKESWAEDCDWELPERILGLVFAGELCDLLRLSAALAKNPNLPVILTGLLSWYRDGVVWTKTECAKLLNIPSADTKMFKPLAGQTKKGEQAIILLNQSLNNLSRNANARLTIDVLFLKLCFLFSGKYNPKGVA